MGGGDLGPWPPFLDQLMSLRGVLISPPLPIRTLISRSFLSPTDGAGGDLPPPVPR